MSKRMGLRLTYFSLGFTLGGVFINHFLEKWYFKRVAELIDEMNLRTDFINWILNEGIYLDNDEFYPQAKERAKFINIVTRQIGE